MREHFTALVLHGADGLVRIIEPTDRRKGYAMEKYEQLEMEVIVFDTEDIVTASGDIPLEPVD